MNLNKTKIIGALGTVGSIMFGVILKVLIDKPILYNSWTFIKNILLINIPFWIVVILFLVIILFLIFGPFKIVKKYNKNKLKKDKKVFNKIVKEIEQYYNFVCLEGKGGALDSYQTEKELKTLKKIIKDLKYDFFDKEYNKYKKEMINSFILIFEIYFDKKEWEKHELGVYIHYHDFIETINKGKGRHVDDLIEKCSSRYNKFIEYGRNKFNI